MDESLMDIIDVAAARFDQRPIYHASFATQMELRKLEEEIQRAAQLQAASREPATDDKK